MTTTSAATKAMDAPSSDTIGDSGGLSPSKGLAGSSATDSGIREPTTLDLVELLLKDPASADRLNRELDLQRLLFPRFLLIAQASYLLFALVFVLLLNLAPPAAYPHFSTLPMPPANWADGTAFSLPLAYMIGIVLAACVCLPSFYFYSLLAGVKLTWAQITSLLGKGLASNAILLVGLLPVYMAVALGLIILEAPVAYLRCALMVGLLLPFLSGLWGLYAIYLGVKDWIVTMPQQWRCRRWCFLRRLVFSWAAVYATILPVMVYRLWEYFAAHSLVGS